MPSLRWIIVEPDAQARARLERLIGSWGQNAGLFSDPLEGVESAHQIPLELIFGPAETGFFGRVPPGIQRIALGHPEQALAMAQQGIEGFLPRPFQPADVMALLARMDQWQSAPHRLWVMQDGRPVLIHTADVYWIEHHDRQVTLHTLLGPFQSLNTLTQLQAHCPNWLRIHRHLLIAPQWVTDLGDQGVRVTGCDRRLPVSRRQRHALRRAVLARQHGVPSR